MTRAVPPAAQTLGVNPGQDPRLWANALQPRLDAQKKHGLEFDQLYSGERHNLLVLELFVEVFGGLDPTGQARILTKLCPPEANIAAIGIDAVAERLIVDGFRVGSDDNQAGADKATQLWLGNDLDAMSLVAHVESLVKGTCAGLVWPGQDGEPVISIEDATQMVLHRQSAPPYDVDAALKVWADEWTGRTSAMVWLPDWRYTLRLDDRTETINGVTSAWRLDGDPVVSTPYVPVVELAARTRLLRPPTSDLVSVAPLIDTYWLLLADMVVAADTGAFPIRTATGIKLERDYAGRPVSPFNARADHAMVSENPDAKFSSLEAANLAGYVTALDSVLRQVRTITRVPEHYYGQGAAAGISGETINAAEASLVRKVEGLQPRFGGGWRRLVSYAFDTSGFASTQVTTRWRDTRTRVLAQDVDAAQKLHDIGVPLDIVLERIGFDRATIQRAMSASTGPAAQQQAAALLAAVNAGLPKPAPSVPAAA